MTGRIAAKQALAAGYVVEHIPRSGGRYAVFDETGSRVSRIYDSRELAAAGRERLIESEAQRRGMMTRPCMCCRRPFESEGIHNRLCNGCRSSSETAVSSGGGYSITQLRKRR